MFKVVLIFCFLTESMIAGIPVRSKGEIVVVEVQTHGHRCLVVDSVNLSDNAPVVFILHEFGGNANELLPLIEKMELPPCRYVIPDAPLKISGNTYAWYNFKTQSDEDRTNSRDYLFELMRNFSEKGQKQGRARPIIMIGFSEGGVMSMEAGLNYKGKVSAIVSMGGYIWNPVKSLAHPTAPKNIPLLLVRGTKDLIVPESWTQKTIKGLKAAGYHPVLKKFPIGHQIDKDSIVEVAKFLKTVVMK